MIGLRIPPNGRCTDHQLKGDELNERLVIHCDKRDDKNGNTSHLYQVGFYETPEEFENGQVVAEIRFQHGARGEPGSQVGVTDAALVSVLLDRYRGFQSGKGSACRENAVVITKLEEALMWMQKRTQDRMRRGVLGKNQP